MKLHILKKSARLWTFSAVLAAEIYPILWAAQTKVENPNKKKRENQPKVIIEMMMVIEDGDWAVEWKVPNNSS